MTDVLWSRSQSIDTNPETNKSPLLAKKVFRLVLGIHIWLSEPLRKQIHSELYLLAGSILLIGWLLLSAADLGDGWYEAISFSWPIFIAIGIYRLRFVIKKGLFR